MSNLFAIVGRLLTGMFATERAAVDPDSMSLHDWADLPSHHPVNGRAPC